MAYESAYGTLHSPMNGLGATAGGGWCSDKHPAGNCKPLRNICKPIDADTLESVKKAQRFANAILLATKKSLIDVDGRIGPKSVSAINSILGMSMTHCDQAMGRLGEIVPALFAIVAQGGLTVPPDVSKTPPSVPGPGGSVVNPPNSAIQQAGIGAVFSSPMGIAALVVGGLLIWKSTQKPTKKRKKRAKARRKRRLAKRRITTSYF